MLPCRVRGVLHAYSRRRFPRDVDTVYDTPAMGAAYGRAGWIADIHGARGLSRRRLFRNLGEKTYYHGGRT